MDHVDIDNARLGNRLDRHVAARALPLVVLVGEHRADEPNDRVAWQGCRRHACVF